MAEDGFELLHHLAELGPYDLVVTTEDLPGLRGSQVLATARTTGLETPFLLIAPIVSSRLAGLVARAAPAALIDDPLDGNRIAAAAADLLESREPIEWAASVGAETVYSVK